MFAGGATTEAAEAVTGADLDALQGLVDKQLLLRRHDAGPDPRLSMLETVREYARERLDADPDAAQVRERHCRHYLALAERAEPELFTRGEGVWLPRLDAEVDNFRAALDWSLRHGNPTQGLRLAGLLARFWEIRNRHAEGLDWIEAALEAAGDDAPVRDRARARWAQVYLLIDLGAAYDAEGLLTEARSKAVEALALAREAAEPTLVADALLALADLDMAQSHPQRRRRALADEALQVASEAGDERLVAARADGASVRGSTGGRHGRARAGGDRAAQARQHAPPRSCSTTTPPTTPSRRAAPRPHGRSWLRRSRSPMSSEIRSSWPSRAATSVWRHSSPMIWTGRGTRSTSSFGCAGSTS